MALEHENEALENWATVVLILIIVIFTAAFEFCTTGILKWLSKQGLPGLRNMLNAVFKELAILGFISLLLFSAVRSGIAQKINDKIFGQTETEKAAVKEALEKGQNPAPPTTLQELFEDVHILIFVIMVMYIIEAATLLLVGRRTIQSFATLDRQSKEELAETLLQMHPQQNGSSPALTKHYADVLVFYGLRERFLNPPIPTFVKPQDKSFPFARYLAANYTEVLVELIELPVTSLLISVVVALLLRPFMVLQGVPFLLFLVAVALGLFVLTLGAWIIVHRGYSLLLPNPGRIKRYIMLAGNNEALEMTVKDAVEGMTRLRAPSDVFKAPIDDIPVFAKALFSTANRVERQIPGSSLTVFRQCLQLLLFLNAVFTAVVLHDAISIVPSEIGLWWSHRTWSYPLTLGIVFVNLTCWVSLIREFVCLTCLDCEVNEVMIREVQEAVEHEEFQRHAEILRMMFHKADHAHTTESPERTAAEMERVALEFSRLPSQTRNLVTLIFAAVSRHHDCLGEPTMRGVVTKNDMREALRLMGWNTDRLSTYILTSWFDERDVNQHGFLTFTGFVQVIMLSTSLGDALKDPQETRVSRRKKIKALFDVLDENHDEELSIAEIMKMLEGMTPRATEKEVTHLVQRLSDGGRTVTFPQLIEFVESMEISKGADHV